MPRHQRPLASETFYHVFNRGVNKESIVRNDLDRRFFMQCLADSVQKYNIELYAYCLLTNHYHLYLQTLHPNLNQMLWFAMTRYAKYFNEKYQRVGPVFQGRYRARLVTHDRYSHTLIRYIHRNPVTAGIVERPEQYPWSSYGNYVGVFPEWQWMNTHWFLNQLDADKSRAVEIFREAHQFPLPVEVESKINNLRCRLTL